MTSMMKFASLAVIAALGAASAADATVTIYTSQAAFAAATNSLGLDTFNDFANTTSTNSPITRNAGVYGYSASVSTTSFFGAGTGVDHWLSTNTATDTVTFYGFTGGVSALGGQFFNSDILGLFTAGPGLTITASDASGTVSYVLTNATTTSFLGFVSTTGLLNATVTANQPATGFVWPTINNLVLGKANAAPAVPEPATWAMLIAGFGLVGGAMRRRKASIAFA